MRTNLRQQNSFAGAIAAFTLPEMMVTLSIFSMLVIALVTTQIMGLKMHRISETKLISTAEGREAMNRARDEIRTSKMLAVGIGDAASFTPIPNNAPQIGNALQIYPTTNKNMYVRYFMDGTNSLKRLALGKVQTVANYVTNQIVFCAEDFSGTVLTNSQNNRVIRMTLEFYQWEFPGANVGNGGIYDYYRLQTRVTRRAID